MMKTRMKLSDFYSITEIAQGDNTIFKSLKDETDYPSVHDFITDNNYSTLNVDYYLSHSNDKYLSPLVNKLYEQYNGNKLIINNLIVKIIYERFSTKWKKIYDALMTQYLPLENYNMEEERSNDKEYSDTGTQKTEISVDRETLATSSYRGFNSTEFAPISKTDGEENTTTTGSDENNVSQKDGTSSEDETTSRHGNIGVTTSQQMLESEFKVRQYDFYKQMYNDIDSILCLSVY